MFKKLLLAVAITLPLSGFAQKFGVVEIEKVFMAMPETEAMKNQLAEASKKYEDEFQKLNEEFNKLYTEYQAIANDPNTPDAIKERRIQEIQERSQKIEQFRAAAQQDLTRQQEQLSAPVQQKIMDAIGVVGQEGGYTLILPNDGVLLYKGAGVVDATPDVLKKLGL